MATIPFIAYEISGVKEPIYPSGAANKKYVDTLSGNIDARIDAISPFDGTNYITSTNSIARFADSSNVRYRFVQSGGVKWVDLTDAGETTLHIHDGRYYTETESVANFANSANVHFRFMASAQSKSLLLSSQKIKQHAYHTKISSQYLAVNYGWAITTDGVATIAHGLLSLPKSHWVLPSGNISFGVVTKVDTTNITAQITAAGSRILQWWASV